MKTKSLLSHLSELETSLNSFSFEELTAEDASHLQQTFLSFKKLAEAKIWGEPYEQEQQKPVLKAESGSWVSGLKKELQLVATVCHEIRTPLSGIVDIADSLKETSLSAAQEHHVVAIASACRNSLDTINELMEYSRLSSGLVHFELVPFNFHNLIREVTYLCDTLIMEKSIGLDINLDPAIPKYLKGDPSGVSQVLLSLLGNAIGLVKEGAVSLHISIEEQAGQETTLRFVVSDTGIGIAASDLEHIFTSFRKAGNITYRENGGSGLEMGIARQLIEKMGGRISVASTLGQGTTFTFIMPFERTVESDFRKSNAGGSALHLSIINEGLPPGGNAIKIDLAPLLQDCLGKIEILEDLVALYKQNALEFIGTVKVCLARADFEGIAFAADKIRCAIKMFRTDNLSFLAEQIHKTSRLNQDIRHLKFLHNCFLEEYPLVEAALEVALTEIKNKT